MMVVEDKKVDYGCDLDDSYELDPNTGDFKIVCGVENAKQAIRNRLMTKYDELAELGYREYGNLAWEELGHTDIEVAKGHVQIFTTYCLAQDPRVRDLVHIETVYENQVIIVKMRLQLVGGEIESIDAIFPRDKW